MADFFQWNPKTLSVSVPAMDDEHQGIAFWPSSHIQGIDHKYGEHATKSGAKAR